MRGDDRANMVAFEGLVVALILLAAIYTTMNMTQATTDSTVSRRELQTMASDALIVLAGLRESRGPILDVSMAEAMDCRSGQNPPPDLCDGTRPNNLSYRLEGYLPEGAGYSIALDNGVEVRTLHTKTGTGGERVSASYAFTPDWNFTFLSTDLSCHEADMSVNVTLIPMRNGDSPDPRYIDAEAAGVTTNATASPTAGLWNATLEPSAIGETLHARVNASRGAYEGSTQSAACDLGGAGWTLRDALNLSVGTALSANGLATAPLGEDVTFVHDFRAVEQLVPNATLVSVDATLYEPIPGRQGVPDAYIVADTIALGSDWSGTSTWTMPQDSLYGHHPVLLSAHLEVPNSSGGTTMLEARIVTLLTVALPSGVVPIEPPYRAVLEVWMPDWG